MNSRSKALDEIYTIYTPLHRSELKNFRFSQKSMIFADFVLDLLKIDWNCSFFIENFAEFCRNFGKLQTIAGSYSLLEKLPEILKKIFNFHSENIWFYLIFIRKIFNFHYCKYLIFHLIFTYAPHPRTCVRTVARRRSDSSPAARSSRSRRSALRASS